MKKEYEDILKKYKESESAKIYCPVCGYKYSKYLKECPQCFENKILKKRNK